MGSSRKCCDWMRIQDLCFVICFPSSNNQPPSVHLSLYKLSITIPRSLVDVGRKLYIQRKVMLIVSLYITPT